MAVLEDTATGMEVAHVNGCGNGRDDYGYMIRIACAYASFRWILLVSMPSVCLRNIVIADSESGSVNGGDYAHDGCGSLLKLAEHKLKPCSRYQRFRSSLEARPILCNAHICFFSVVASLLRRLDSFAGRDSSRTDYAIRNRDRG